MRHKQLGTLVLLACLPWAGGQSAYGQAAPVPPAPLPVTMEQAVAYALAHNPTLLSAQQNLLSLKGQEVEAGLRQNPDFTVYGSDLSNPATSTTPYAVSLQLERLFER